jgi:hypothetical protein
MRFDVAAVDGKLVGNGAGGRHLLEDALPDATLRPAIVPVVVDRCRRPIDGRNVAPSTACLQDMQDARDDRAVVNARLPGLPRGRCGLSAFQASSDSHNKLFAMTIALQRLKSGANIQSKSLTVRVPNLERRQHCRIQVIAGQNGELIDRETFEREHLKKPPRYLRRPRLGALGEGHAP